jgi:hypothetical protein
LRQRAQRGDLLHPHRGDSHIVQGLEVTSSFQHPTDGRGEQTQVSLVVVGEPVAVAGGAGDLVDQFQGAQDFIAQLERDAYEGTIDAGGKM